MTTRIFAVTGLVAVLSAAPAVADVTTLNALVPSAAQTGTTLDPLAFGTGTVAGVTAWWPLQQIWDGSNAITVKAGSSSPQAADTALVVALSPNSSLPAGAAKESGGNLDTIAGAVSSSVVQSNIKHFGGMPISMGQQLSGASIPVVLPAAQVASLTPPTTVIVTQGTGGNLNATVGGSGTAGTPAAGVVSVQGVSGGQALPVTAAALPLPTGAALETGGNLANIATNIGRTNAGTTAANALPIQGVTGGVPVQSAPQSVAASGGWTPSKVYGLTGPTLISSGAHQVARIQCDNIAGTAPAFVELFDSAAVTLGTTVPVDYIAIPTGGTGGFSLSNPGLQMSNGISLAAVTAAGSAGTTIYGGSTTSTSWTVNCSISYK